MQKKKAIEIKI